MRSHGADDAIDAIDAFFLGEDYWEKFVECVRGVFDVEGHLCISEFYIPHEGGETFDETVKNEIEEKVQSVDAFQNGDVYARIVSRLSTPTPFPWQEYRYTDFEEKFPATRAGKLANAQARQNWEAAKQLKDERLTKTAQLDYFSLLLIVDRAWETIRLRLAGKLDTTSALRHGVLTRCRAFGLHAALLRSFEVANKFAREGFHDSKTALRELLLFLRIFTSNRAECRASIAIRIQSLLGQI